MKARRKQVMTPEQRRWHEFVERLEGPGGCNFRETDGQFTWGCDGTSERPLARKHLEEMGFDVEASLAYFSEHGGHCDCEILFNVQAGTEDLTATVAAAIWEAHQ